MAEKIVKRGEQAMENTDDFMSVERPKEFGERDLSGTEGITKADVKLPRLSLLQSTSPQCTEGDPLFNPDLKPGIFINDITGQIYGKGPFYFAIIRREQPRAMEFAPFAEGGGMIDPDVPLNDDRTKWHGKEKPAATVFHDFISILLPSWEFIVISCKGSSIKSAKTLNGYISMRGDALYRAIYMVTSELKLKPKPHQIFHFKNAGWASPGAEEKLKALFDQFKDKVVEFDRDTAEDIEGEGDTDFPPVPDVDGEPAPA
jgi:hypothetical protein